MFLKNIAVIPKNENTENIVKLLKIIYKDAKITALSFKQILENKNRKYDLVLFDIDDTEKSEVLDNLEKYKRIIHFPTVCLISDFRNSSIRNIGFKPDTDFIIKPFAQEEIIKLLDLIYLKHKYDKQLYTGIQLETLIETLQEGIVVVDDRENILYTNSSVARIFSIQDRDLVG